MENWRGKPLHSWTQQELVNLALSIFNERVENGEKVDLQKLRRAAHARTRLTNSLALDQAIQKTFNVDENGKVSIKPPPPSEE